TESSPPRSNRPTSRPASPSNAGSSASPSDTSSMQITTPAANSSPPGDSARTTPAGRARWASSMVATSYFRHLVKAMEGLPRRARPMWARKRLDAQESPVDGLDDAIAKGSQVSDWAAQFGCRNVGDGRHKEDEVSTAKLNDRHQSPGYGADL